MIPKKHAPDVIRGGNRFSDKIMPDNKKGPDLMQLRQALAVDASQIPLPTATRPSTRFHPIGSLTMIAASSEAAIGFTVIVLATRVGVVFCSASTQRKNAAAPPKAP